MSMLEKLSELEARRIAIQTNGNKNTLSARDRITQLFDENSFVEIGTFIKSRSTAFNMNVQDTPAEGVVCGYGTVQGNLVYAYSQDNTVMGGAIGEMHAKKIAKTYEDAIKMGVPIVAFIDSAGIRLQEHVDALDGYGMIFSKSVEASGHIPQLTVVCGDCAGGTSILAGLADFVFIVEKTGRMFLNSPNTIADQKATFDTVAAPKVHLEESGLVQFASTNEAELIGKVKEIISYLPSNSDEDVPCYECQDDLNRIDENLNYFEFGVNDIKDIIASVADNNEMIEIAAEYSETIFTGFIRMNGATVGTIANKKPSCDYKGVKKITHFVKLCDGFNIPVLTLTDIEHFESTVVTEQLGIIKETSHLVQAFADATVPKVNVILNHAYGNAYVAMNSKHIGADYVYAWPTAEIGTMNSESAIRIMYDKEIQVADRAVDYIANKTEEFNALNTSAYAVAARGYVDDIIEPAATRKRVIAALEVLFTKEVNGVYKKHPTL